MESKKLRRHEEEKEEEHNIVAEFNELGIDERLARCLETDFSISSLFPLQHHTIQQLLEHPTQDACISAPTGTGKTLMFSLPLVHLLSRRVITRCRGLVLCPSRDLAQQVHGVIQSLCRSVGLTCVLVAGEYSVQTESSRLLDSKTGACLADIVVCTPGRLLDHLARFSLEHLEFLVIDEADRMLNQSYQNWLDRIYESAFKNRENTSTRSVFMLQRGDVFLRKFICSATLTRNPEKLSKLALFRPLLLSPSSLDSAAAGEEESSFHHQLPSTLTELCYRVTVDNKPLVLLHLLETAAEERTLVFCSSIARAEKLGMLLKHCGISCAMMSGKSSTLERANMLESFKLEKFKVLIGTDLAARGIDIPFLKRVISYDVPTHASTYVHRSGRTARAGLGGTSITLLQNEQARHFREIKLKIKSPQAFRFLEVESAQLDVWKEQFQKWKENTKS